MQSNSKFWTEASAQKWSRYVLEERPHLISSGQSVPEFLEDEWEVADAERGQDLDQRVPADVAHVLGSTLQHLAHTLIRTLGRFRWRVFLGRACRSLTIARAMGTRRISSSSAIVKRAFLWCSSLLAWMFNEEVKGNVMVPSIIIIIIIIYNNRALRGISIELCTKCFFLFFLFCFILQWQNQENCLN